jgi:hypothetical protein
MPSPAMKEFSTLPTITSLSMQRVKFLLGPIICMFTTIQSLNHYIRTIYGDSELSFIGELWTFPIQGVGQGNAAGLKFGP